MKNDVFFLNNKVIRHPYDVQKKFWEGHTPSVRCPKKVLGRSYGIRTMPKKSFGKVIRHPYDAQKKFWEDHTPSIRCPKKVLGRSYAIRTMPKMSWDVCKNILNPIKRKQVLRVPVIASLYKKIKQGEMTA